jgi:uncharacterized protein YvpB
MERLMKGYAAILTVVAIAGLAVGAPASASAAPSTGGGVTLDGYGGLHPFGNFPLSTTGAPAWPNWDIARAVTLRPNGSGGWVLDGFGGIHAFGAAARVISPAYWSGWDIARAIVMTSRDSGGMPDGRQGYLLDGFGGVHTWGGAPSLNGFPYTPNQDRARGLEIHYNSAGAPDGGWVLDRSGHVSAFGAAPALSISLPKAPIYQQLHGAATSGHVVGKFGVITTYGAGVSPYWNGYGDFGSQDIMRDVVLINPSNPTPTAQPISPSAAAAYQSWTNPHGGVILDGWGGLHPFGVGLDTRGSRWWSGWDIARAVSIRPDGSGGWTLDGFGGIHNFGLASPVATPAYWSGWDIARAIVITSKDVDGLPDGRQGYLLDGFGGVHAWGGAPKLSGWPYSQNDDRWRGLEIHYNANGLPDGGWELDRAGQVVSFGAAPAVNVSGLPQAPVMQQLHMAGAGGYVVGKWGTVRTWGQGVSPYWSGYSDWGAWDIMRDLVLINPTNPAPTPQPASAAATGRLSGATNLNATISDPLIRQTHNLDCESAALRMALLAKGIDRSENWILGQMGADLRRAVVNPYGDVLRWGDPYQTFVGDVNGLDYNATGYGVYYPPIFMAAQRAYRSGLAKEGWNPHDLYVEVASGNPAVVWVPVYGYWASATMRYWTAWDGRQIRYTLVEHAMTLIGVNAGAGTVTLNDPNRGFVRTVSMAAFEAAFAKFNNMAVVVY